MKEKNIGIVLVVITLVLVIIIGFFISSNKSNTETKKSYNNITDQAVAESRAVKDSEKKEFTDINVNKFIELYKGTENKIVLFSRPTCGYCQIAEPILQNIAYKYNIEINHVNTDEMSEEDSNNLKAVNEEFDSFGTPFLVIVSNNGIVDKVSGLTVKSSYKEFFKKYKFIK